MFKELNPLLHSELRLAVVSILIGVESADFVFIRQQTGATAGNLSVQLDKLAKAGYIEVEKTFPGQDSLHGMPHHRRRTRRLRRIRRGAAKLYKEIGCSLVLHPKSFLFNFWSAVQDFIREMFFPKKTPGYRGLRLRRVM